MRGLLFLTLNVICSLPSARAYAPRVGSPRQRARCSATVEKPRVGSEAGFEFDLDLAQTDGQTPEEIVRAARDALKGEFEAIDARTQRNMRKVLQAFKKRRVGAGEVNGGVDGYAHGDLGREAIDGVYADILGAEAAMVRSQIFSGTHAISCALFSCLRPGDTMLAISGAPYDTLEEVIGLRPPSPPEEYEFGVSQSPKSSDALDDGLDLSGLPLDGSLREWGIEYQEVPLLEDATFDLDAIDAALEKHPSTRLIHVQRSCGYAWRSALPIQEIKRVCDHVAVINRGRREERKKALGGGSPEGGPGGGSGSPKTPPAKEEQEEAALPRELVVFVDNCYGEFVEDLEPCHVGTHLVAGSLIKNPGGTLARTGGYVAGRKELVAAAARRLSAPGVGGGATLGQNRWILQGLFQAPGTVAESVKGAMLVAQVLGGSLGMPCSPPPVPLGGQAATAGESGRPRSDIVQKVRMGSRETMVRFCEAVQRNSPVGAFIRPTPGQSSGYGGEVVFADGSFVDGSTAELSADGPLRPPFTAYAQGGTNHAHWAIILEDMLEGLTAQEKGNDPIQPCA
mmetsp:Transcript_56872/g.128890  ORF Transcript_56872/g.128890 Transcript_56872/m.128890 type:complete len:568 (+) Transcript_56872:122-1825(+)